MSNPTKQIDLFKQFLKEYAEATGDLLSLLKPDKKHQKKIDAWAEKWNKIPGMLTEIEKYITPIEALEIKYPKFFTMDLLKTWEFWKAYLQEQHNIILKSRAEIKQIAYLAEITNKDPELAIKYLDFAMANLYTRFFKLNNKFDQPDKSSPKNGSDFN